MLVILILKGLVSIGKKLSAHFLLNPVYNFQNFVDNLVHDA